MRVLHFSRSFSPLYQTFVYDYVVELERQGVDNHVVTINRQNTATRPFEKVYVIKAPGRSPLSRFYRRTLALFTQRSISEVSWPTLRCRLRRAIAEISPDIIHAHFGYEAVLVAPNAAEASIPLIATFYGYDVSRLPREMRWRKYYSQLWRDLSGVTVLSQTMRDAILRLGCPQSLVHVVRLGRTCDLPHKGTTHPIKRFISVGRLVEKKGYLDVIHAFRRIITDYPDVRLDIVGGGDLRPQIESLIDHLGLRGHVSVHGPVPSEQTLQLMANADAFVLCSKTATNGDQEGTPAVLIEAQSLGLPCVATTHAGIPEMIPPENHRLLAGEGDIAGIAERLRWLICSPKTVVGDITLRGRSFVREKFDLVTQVSNLRSVYTNVLEIRCSQDKCLVEP
jgi:colanic acid/amylovoran biosynthesis glycosyltransferase